MNNFNIDLMAMVCGVGAASEALADGGVSCGLPRKLSQDLAIQTVLGAAELAAIVEETMPGALPRKVRVR